MPQDGLFLLAAGVAAFLVGLSKGGLPLIGMLSVPLLALTIPAFQAATLLLPVFVFADVISIWLYRRHFSRRNLAILVPAGLLGVLIGFMTVAVIPDAAVALLVGAVGLVFSMNAWRKRGVQLPPRPADVPRGLLWGAAAGFTSFLSHAGGPPYQIYVLPQKLDKLTFVGTTTIVFAAINAAKVVPFQVLSPLTGDQWRMVAGLLPVAALGALTGRRALNVIPERTFYALVEAGLFIVSLMLCYTAIREFSGG
ncbi:MAG: sulfite exporter TauE/SafE family protein [Pseudochelatococcus sp.]|jgi:uncharacterized membrane protein YfcA|uniref:sulfite exporter TauE/SafE family protein n=1 Tax=Pseudochelatococcus sp. TaxID=2020869 RepID=UPI003D8F9F0A